MHNVRLPEGLSLLSRYILEVTLWAARHIEEGGIDYHYHANPARGNNQSRLWEQATARHF